MAEIKPFRALRYDERQAGPLEDLVAPPYDVIASEERERYLAKSPHNIVHLTLPESEAEAGWLFREWRQQKILVPDEAAFWALSQDYVGPDGVARTRTGLVGSLKVEPYETGTVLPHERTHRGPKEGRLRLLREVGAQLEPIFLLHEGERPFDVPERAPDLEVEGTRLWRLDEAAAISEAFADRQLLIADGHHRYETALAYHDETGTPASGYMLVVLVSADDPGLEIFPTHRVFEAWPPVLDELVHIPEKNVEKALEKLTDRSHDEPAFVLYEHGRASIVVDGADGELDVRFVDRLGQERLSYSSDSQDAVGAVDSGKAEVAVLMRATRIEDVFAVAKRGETMPQKSTYFFPKLLSGLLIHPLEP